MPNITQARTIHNAVRHHLLVLLYQDEELSISDTELLLDAIEVRPNENGKRYGERIIIGIDTYVKQRRPCFTYVEVLTTLGSEEPLAQPVAQGLYVRYRDRNMDAIDGEYDVETLNERFGL